MCEALERRFKQEKIIGVIEFLRINGTPDKDIVSKITAAFNVTKDYVFALLTPQEA